jgi:anaerobic selenocysteine-containing dehydrogenase
MTAGGIENRLKALQARGGKYVVIDPRRTETALKADEHHFIKPGSDVLFLLAMVHTIFDENLIKLGRLEAIVDNLDAVRNAVADFPPEAVADATGIDAEIIRRIVHEFTSAESAVCYGRMGLSTQAFGGLGNWLINVLNIITGNLDEPGGAMFTLPAIDVIGVTSLTGQTGRYGRWNSRVRGLPEFSGELPVSVLAEEILTEGEGQIKAMVTVAGNPALSTPNGAQLDEAFESLEFMVAIDIYINETTRHANIILPPTTALETEHYDLVFHYLALRNTAKYGEALFEPEAGTMHDWEILRELRLRLEGVDRTERAPKLDFFRRLPPQKILDLGLRFGPYGNWGGRKALVGDGVTLTKLKRHPLGIYLGGLTSLLQKRLATPNMRIDLAP